MKRVRRTFFNALGTILPFLAITTAALWIRSVFAVDSLQLSIQNSLGPNTVLLNGWYFGSGWGTVWISRGSATYEKPVATDQPKPYVWEWKTDADRSLVPLRDRILPPGSGFVLEKTAPNPWCPNGELKLRVPHWSLFLLSAAMTYAC